MTKGNKKQRKERGDRKKTNKKDRETGRKT
jgi:hypothetical protein